MVPVPQRYAPLVIGRSFTPQQFWDTVIDQVVADGNAAMCSTLVDWARVASTYRVAPAAAAAGAVAVFAPPDICIVAPTAPVMDHGLRRAVWGWLSHDLPALVTNTTGIAQHLVNITTEMANTRFEAAAARAAATMAAAAATTFSSKYPNAGTTLHRICHVTRDADMSIFWQLFATVQKAEYTNLLQNACDTRAASHPYNFSAPQITPEMMEVVKNFRFGCVDMDDMMAGLSACLLTSGDAGVIAAARRRTQTYNMVIGQHASAGMVELQQLVAEAPAMPMTVWQTTTTFQGFSIVLDVLWKEAHPTSVLYRDFVLAFMRVAGQIEANYTADQIPPLLPLFMRMHQLEFYRHTNELKQLGAAASLPRFMEMIRLIENRQWALLPPMPLRLFNQEAMLPQVHVPALSPALIPPAAPAPPAAGGQQASTPRGRVQNAVQNPSPTALVSRFTAANRALRDILQNRVVPRMDNGRGELCCSFHLRGSCFLECNRAAAHRPLSAAETTRIGELLTAAGVP
jgi:hypothetical protein